MTLNEKIELCCKCCRYSHYYTEKVVSKKCCGNGRKLLSGNVGEETIDADGRKITYFCKNFEWD